MNQRHEHHVETNTNNVTGSNLYGTSVVSGSGATVSVQHNQGTAQEQEALTAAAQVEAELRGALAALDRRDDQTRESLKEALGRLDELAEELRAGANKRDPERTKRLMTGIKDTVAGLAGIVTGVDGLWAAVQSVLR